MYRLLISVVGSVRLDSVLLMEDSILDSCYEIWSNFANNCREALIIKL
jgi:hypothetical protein